MTICTDVTCKDRTLPLSFKALCTHCAAPQALKDEDMFSKCIPLEHVTRASMVEAAHNNTCIREHEVIPCEMLPA